MTIKLVALLLALIFRISWTQEYYVSPIPPPNPNCPSDKPCHTLRYYASNSSTLLSGRENISLIFLEGVHNSVHMTLEISDFTLLTLMGSSEFIFNNPEVEILNLTAFIANGSSLVVKNFAMHFSQFNVTNVSNVNSYQLLLNGVVSTIIANTVNSISLLKSKLVASQWLLFWGYREPFYLSQDIDIGAVGFVQASVTVPTIIISNVEVRRKESILSIALALLNSSVGMTIDNCVFFDSFGLLLGIYQEFENPFSSVVLEIQDCSWHMCLNGIRLGVINTAISLLMSRCNFSQNNYGFVIYNIRGSANLSIFDSYFIDGSNIDSSAYGILFLNFEPRAKAELLLNNVSIVNNSISYGVMTFIGPVNVTVFDCYFGGNQAFLTGGIRLVNANLIFKGKTTFFKNKGSSGGAIHMSRDSKLLLEKNSNVSFIQNKAYFGGAIFVDQYSTTEILDDVLGNAAPSCFYQLSYVVEQEHYPVVHLNDNSADFSGDHIFGAALKDRCTVIPDSNVTSYFVFQNIFEIETQSPSDVSSIPTRVCLCEGNEPQCANEDYIFIFKDVIPGENFTLSAMVVGFDFGGVPGTVYASEFQQVGMPINDFRLGKGENAQQAISARNCTDLKYSVYSSSNSSASFFLSTSSVTAATQGFSFFLFSPEEINKSIQTYQDLDYIRANLLYSPVFIELNVLPCPKGFMLDADLCDCDSELKAFATRCVVENGTGVLYRSGTNWISESNGELFLYRFCPFSYCNRIETEALSNTQCALNHSGVLCGGCPPGLSLAIGSSRCLDCPDNKGIPLAFFILFFVMGLIHVSYIKIFDFTVTKGTYNGFIFYANMIWINQEIFFPHINKQINPNLHTFFSVMRVLTAWMNHDFGIETCFIYGLDAYSKVWLQFLYPFYLYGIAILIIIVCNYSTKVTKIFGNNSVAVLSSLFLLGYVKLIRVLYAVFSFAHLNQYQSQNLKAVWLVDGNLSYFDIRHLVLLLFSIIVALLMLILTISLLFISCLHKLPFSVSKLNPFFDSLVGNLKNKHRYWIGLTLMVRIFAAGLAVGFQATVVVSILVVLTAWLSALSLHVYKKIHLSLLDFVYISNVLVVSVCFLSTDDIITRVIYISISVLVANIISFIMLLHHVLPLTKKLYNTLCLRKQTESASTDSTEHSVSVRNISTVSEVEISQRDDHTSVIEPENHFPSQPRKLDVSRLREELVELGLN